MEAKQRLLLPSPNTTLALMTAAMARSASARVSASGFSHHTGLPAAATAPICATCSECGVARNTACTRGSATASENSVPSSKPWVLAKSATSSGSLLTPRMNRSRLLLPCAASTMDLPQRPRPMTAESIIGWPMGGLRGGAHRHILGMPEMPLQAAAPGSYDAARKTAGNGYARNNIDLRRSVMDRRAFLQSGSLAAAVGAAIANVVTPAAAETAGAGAAAHARDWSNRKPKGEPVVKRFDEQRWVLDNIIQANGIDWDQGRTGATLRGLGPGAAPDMDELRKRVKRLVDICPAFESLAKQARSDGQGGRASRRQGRGPRQLLSWRPIIGPRRCGPSTRSTKSSRA